MRIILSGAQGTGKSTIVKAIHEKLPTLSVIDNIASTYIKNKKDLEYFPVYKDFQTKLSLKYMSMFTSNNNFISSRGLADIYAYSVRHRSLNEEKGWKTEPLEIIEKLAISLESEIPSINFYIPIRFSPEETNLRSADITFQHDIDYLIRDFFLKTRKDVYVVESISVEDRVKEILQKIEEIGIEDDFR